MYLLSSRNSRTCQKINQGQGQVQVFDKKINQGQGQVQILTCT